MTFRCGHTSVTDRFIDGEKVEVQNEEKRLAEDMYKDYVAI